MQSDAVHAAMTTTTEQQQQQQPPDDHHGHGGGPGGGGGGGGGEQLRVSYELQLQVQAQLMSMSDEEKVELGHSVTDLIVDCEFAGTTCSSSYVRSIYYTRTWLSSAPKR